VIAGEVRLPRDGEEVRIASVSGGRAPETDDAVGAEAAAPLLFVGTAS
jgi:hypothetical protein